MIKYYADFIIEDRNGVNLTLTRDYEIKDGKNISDAPTMVDDFSLYFEPKMSPK